VSRLQKFSPSSASTKRIAAAEATGNIGDRSERGIYLRIICHTILVGHLRQLSIIGHPPQLNRSRFNNSTLRSQAELTVTPAYQADEYTAVLTRAGADPRSRSGRAARDAHLVRPRPASARWVLAALVWRTYRRMLAASAPFILKYWAWRNDQCVSGCVARREELADRCSVESPHRLH
jgi:hypothetical protein